MCAFWYEWDPLAELNPLQDFGVIWLQSYVDPGPRDTCVFEVRTQVTLPGGWGFEERAPDARIDARSRKGMVTELLTDAGGYSVLPGSVKGAWKWFLFPKGLEEPIVRETATPFGITQRTLEWVWEGKVDRPINFAVGLTFNWDIVNGLLFETGAAIPPVFGASPSSQATFLDCDSPRPESSPFDPGDTATNSATVTQVRLDPVTSTKLRRDVTDGLHKRPGR